MVELIIEKGLEFFKEGRINFSGGSIFILLVIVVLIISLKDLRKKEVDKKSLLNHKIFNFITYSTQIVIPNIRLECEGKSMIVRDFLSIRYSLIEKNLIKLIKDYNFDENDKHSLKSNLIDFITDTISQCEKDSKISDIPEEFVVSFNIWNRRAVDYVEFMVESTTDFEYFNCYELTELILTTIMGTMVASLEDAKFTINKLNGSLSGKIYKNIVLK